MAISKDEFLRQTMEVGVFSALARNVKNGSIPEKNAADVADAFFDFFLAKIEEARRETRYIETVLMRLAASARAGKTPRPGHSWMPKESVINSFTQDLATLHNWVVSLYETDFTMLDAIAPEAAKTGPQKMADAMNKVRVERKNLLAHGKHFPELFY